LIGEYPDIDAWKKTTLYFFAKVAVIASVFTELLGESGVYVFGDRLHEIDGKKVTDARQAAAAAEGKAADALSKEIELERAEAEVSNIATEAAKEAAILAREAQPRTIDSPNFKTLVDEMRKYPNTPIELAAANDWESARLLLQIKDAIDAANWKLEPWSRPGQTLRLNVDDLPPVGSITVHGVRRLTAEADWGTSVWNAANVLVEGLFASGILTISDHDKPDDPNPMARRGTIRLIVGTK
jgi:hypothetical protein